MFFNAKIVSRSTYNSGQLLPYLALYQTAKIVWITSLYTSIYGLFDHFPEHILTCTIRSQPKVTRNTSRIWMLGCQTGLVIKTHASFSGSLGEFSETAADVCRRQPLDNPAPLKAPPLHVFQLRKSDAANALSAASTSIRSPTGSSHCLLRITAH